MNKLFDATGITTEVLDNYRYKTDPLADDTVAKIISSGFEKEVNQVFKSLVTNESVDPSSFKQFDSALQEILNHYFEVTAKLPVWADSELVKKGEQIFSQFGPEIFMLLNVSSLPMCYTCSKGAQVLYDTGRLLTHNGSVDPLARRLMETAQMIVNVMSPGGMSQGGKGVVTIQKIRLIHASIRYFLRTKGVNGTAWDVSTYGEPINQEDLTGTLMSFGPVIINGLDHLGIRLDDHQKGAYMHLWKVVGHQMGIDEPLLPGTYEEGFQLATKILVHQASESDGGKALTQACIDFINHTMPGNAFNELPPYLIATFLENFSNSSGLDLAACIGVRKNDDLKNKLAFSISKFFTSEIDKLEHHAFVRKISGTFNKLLLHGIIHHFNGGKSVNFYIPPSLKKDWGLANEWGDPTSLITLGNNRIVYQKRKK